MKRWIPRIIVLAIVAGLAAFLLIKKPWAAGETPVTFSTVTVSRGNMAAQVTANGTLSARTTVQVGAQVSGRVTELDADFNTQVKKGQVLAKLDESLLKAQIDQAQATYDLQLANEKKAEVALMDADRQLKRQQGLQQQQLIAGATVEGYEVTRDTARAALAASKASVSQAYANLSQARTNLGYATIYSPIDGVVLTRSYDIGQTVQSSFSAPTLFTIAADLSVMQIDTSVSESDVGALKEGMKATFTVDAFPGKTFEGTVRQVRNSPTTTQGVVTYDAVIDVNNQDHALRPGMTANVTFVLDQVADAIKIPNAALRFKPTRDQMMALADKFGMKRGGGSGSGSGHHHRDGSGAGGPSAGGSGGMPRADAASGASGGAGMKFGDKKPVWKLVDGKPKMVLIKPGLTDGSSTQMIEGDLQPGDQLITEIQGLKTSPNRKIGAF
ncbi:MAG: efflux RND transporter periplasmic adaptor subunit [Deltaproteobacteria bacterium]|nr:efflux RND transporter periplasmic adaptor subunit [Deltaproteobacteria bacterium]